MKQYYFLILGLDFDIVPDVASAKKAIIAKTNFWNDDQQQIGKYATYYAALAEQAQRMKNALSEQSGLAKYAQAAADVAYPVIDELLNEAAESSGGRGIDASKFDGLCKLVRKEVAGRCALPFVEISSELIRRRAEAVGVEVNSGDCKTPAQKAYEHYAKDEPAGAVEFRLLDGDLAPLGKRSLYEFACPAGVDEPQALSADELLTHAHDELLSLKNRPVMKSAAEKLMPALQAIVCDEEKRKEYDLFLQWREIHEALESAGQLADLCGGVLGGRNAEELVARIARRVGEDDAWLIAEGYCSQRSPRLVFERKVRTENEAMSDVLTCMDDVPSISCGVSSLNLKVGQTERVEIRATDGEVSCSVSDGSVVRVGLDDNAGHLFVTGLAEGAASLRLQVLDGETSRTAQTPFIPVVVSGRVRRKATIAADTLELKLRVGETGQVRITGQDHGNLECAWNPDDSAVIGGKDGLKWLPGDMLAVTARQPGTIPVKVYSVQDDSHEQSNTVCIKVEVLEEVAQAEYGAAKLVRAYKEATPLDLLSWAIVLVAIVGICHGLAGVCEAGLF